MSDDLAIETTGLTKRLGHTAVVDTVDLAVPRDIEPEVGKLEDVRHVVADQDHRQAAFAHALDQVDHLAGARKRSLSCPLI